MGRASRRAETRSRAVCAARDVLSGFLLGLCWLGCGARTAELETSPRPGPEGSASSVVADAPAPQHTKRFALELAAQPDLDDDTGPAPCDFSRSYRGKMRDAGVTFSLRLDSTGALQGTVHYDDAQPALALSGTMQPDPGAKTTAFTLKEQGGGVYTGTCAAETGVLSGTFSAGNKLVAPFSLSPRPVEWPPLYRLTRRHVTPPNHPACKRLGSRTEVKEVSLDGQEDGPRVLCLPTDESHRRTLLEQNGDESFGCRVEDAGPRVFGLGSPELEQTINGALTYKGYEQDIRETATCNGHDSRHTAATLVQAGAGLLVISRFSSVDAGGIHPFNSVLPTVAIDLVTGKELALADIVRDKNKLRDLASTCIPVYEQASTDELSFELPDDLEPRRCEAEASPSFLWGCREGEEEPVWTLLAQGLVIGMRGNPHVSVAMDGSGPILTWDVLLREGALRGDSPVARLWSGARAATPQTGSCHSALEGSTIRSWRPI